eukprot:11708306-Karenia_brevis.AAC.1
MQHMQAIGAIANHGSALHQVQATFCGRHGQGSQDNQRGISTVDPGYLVPAAQMLHNLTSKISIYH